MDQATSNAIFVIGMVAAIAVPLMAMAAMVIAAW
jgi:hypothetical protein